MFIRWTVTSLTVISDFGSLTHDGFGYLTGKRIDWCKRIGKDIISFKDRGHIRLYDDKFIQGEKYKHRSGIYCCSYVSNSGEALLNKNDATMKVKCSNDPVSDWWEIL